MPDSTVAVAGSSGLIGSALTTALRAAGCRVIRLVRRPPTNPDELHWNPETGDIDLAALRGVDAVVNLCGVNVGDRRWSGAFKQSLRDSRITPTEVLSDAVAKAGIATLVNASAVGFYGDTRDRVVDEADPMGDGFLAQMCSDWESATTAAADSGARVVLVRTGLVLSPAGGLLAKVRPLFALGLGGRFGNGRQYMPWISLTDEVAALRFALDNATVSGPVNLTAPAPVTNSQFTAALGKALNRPALMWVPGMAARLGAGELAGEGLLIGQRAVPAVLQRTGFEFQHATLDDALAYAVPRR